MFSKRTESRSIASQLVLLFTLSAALLLSCGLGVFYWIVVRHAFEEDNAVFADKIAAVQNELRQPGGINALDREIKNQRSGEPAVYWIRVIDSAGSLVTETPRMSDTLPAAVFPAPTRSTMAGSNKTYETDSRLFSLLATTEVRDGASYIIQIAQDRSADERFRKQFRALLGLVLALGIIASTIIAISVTRRGLSPLAKMRRMFERVQAAHLNERVEPARWPRELQPLAASFDDMLARLEDSFTRLSQFSADLAHELRTPIGNMLGEAQVALTRNRSADEYRTVIESTAGECERLSGIIDNLLFLARAESAEQQITRSPFKARAAIEKIISFYQAIAEDRHIELTSNGDAEIFADPMLFNRAIGNLIDNALRFTPDNGKIRIEIATRNNNVEISVSDNGAGIGAEHLPRVFDRFYRADPSRSSAGTGLGLSLVKSIVDLHGGSAKIESTSGRGTTVTLSFPARAAVPV
jgi:two-component system, OmpR family, heavy metal sensor histidine kinase CusS